MPTRSHPPRPGLRHLLTIASLAAVVSLTATPASAEDDLVATVRNGCKQELTDFCSKVTPGKQRVLACLYAHEDKLSGRCEYALYDAAAQLQRALGAISYVVNECKTDLETHCASIEPGGGRLAACIKRNEAALSPRCAQAVKDVDTGIAR